MLTISSYSISAVTTGVTKLHFVPINNRTQARRGRSLGLRQGWRLNGDLQTLGYFSADVCIGTENFRKTFNLIVDTGSSLMALPCSDCKHCGHHRSGARYDAMSNKIYQCTNPPHGMTCSCQGSNDCTYSVSYTEGSMIRGRMVKDTVRFASDEGARDIPIDFGCQSYESGLFYSQEADGIVGFAPRGSFGRTLHEELVTSTGR